MKYIYKVGLCAVIASVPMLMFNLQPGGPGGQFERLAECRSAHRDVPVEICTVPEWRKLSDNIEETFASVRQNFARSSRVQTALDETHQSYLETRMVRPHAVAAVMAMGGNPSINADFLRDQLEHRSPEMFARTAIALGSDVNAPEDNMRLYRRFLRAIDAPREDIEGEWISPYSAIHIDAHGHARVKIFQAGPNLRECSIPAKATISADGALIQDGEASIVDHLLAAATLQGSPPTLGGWTLRAKRRGDLLIVEELTPEREKEKDDDLVRPYCHGSAGLSGTYFPAR